MRTLGIGWIFIVAIGISACAPSSNANQSTSVNQNEQGAFYQTMSIDEFAGVMADSDRAFTVVNVHIPYEGEIEGTDLNVAFNDIDALIASLPDKAAPIILYCRSGNMSEQAARELAELGYTQVYDIPGGMNAWQSSGRTLMSNP